MALIRMRKKDILAAKEACNISESTINGIKVININLTEALHTTAAVYGLGIREVNNNNRATGKGLKEVIKGDDEREIAGKEGELAASIYLMGDAWAAIKQWRMGITDSGDLIIWQNNQQKVIDVKMRTQPYHCCFKLTLKQWRNSCPDYYVATQYPTADREQVRIWGYIERKRIDTLIIEETKRILGKPVIWEYEGTGPEKHVKMTNIELMNLTNSLLKSPQLDYFDKESEVDQEGIGRMYFTPEIIIPFEALEPIEELKNTL